MGLYLFGYRIWPGIWLGSFLINCSTSFDGVSWASMLKSISVAAGIGAGATVQALVGLSLILKFGRATRILSEEKITLAIMILGGPIACLINSSVAVALLFVSGIIPLKEVPFNWFTWWVGDTIGVVVIAPALLFLVTPSPASWGRRLTVVLPWLSIFAFAILFFLYSSQLDQKRIASDLERKTLILKESIQKNITYSEGSLVALGSLVRLDRTLTPEHLARFSKDLLKIYPGVQKLQWFSIGTAAEQEAFAHWAATTTMIQTQGPLIFYSKSRTSEEPVSVYTLLPIYDSGSKLRGYAIATLLLAEMIRDSLADFSKQGIQVWLTSEGERRQALYSSQPDTPLPFTLEPKSSGTLYSTQVLVLPVEVAGGNHVWKLHLAQSREYLVANRNWQAWIFLVAGLLFAGMVAIFLLELTHRTEKVQLLVDQKTEILKQRTAELERQIKDRKATEEKLRQSQKMEAIGRLAGGIAHDFNNILGIIVFASELVRQELDPEDPSLENVKAIQHAANRGAELTHQLLAFTRKQVLQPRVINANEILERMKFILHRLVGEDIQLTLQLEAHVGHVKADPGQLEQVIMNLAANARDAMPAGGMLSISTETIELTAKGQDRYYGNTPASGLFTAISVTDTGMGMGPKTLARLFEPYFTTKETGKGTGLGLSTVLGIVEQSRGTLTVDSSLEKGSTFKIFLPVTTERPPETAPQRRTTEALHGNETILLVEDEAPLRNIIATLLRRFGYTVLDTGHPLEAISIADQPTHAIDLVLTDIIMPEMSGTALVEKLSKIHTSMHVLFMSGYTDDKLQKHGISMGETSFIEKPFKTEDLLHRIRELLDRRKPRHLPT